MRSEGYAVRVTVVGVCVCVCVCVYLSVCLSVYPSVSPFEYEYCLAGYIHFTEIVVLHTENVAGVDKLRDSKMLRGTK